MTYLSIRTGLVVSIDNQTYVLTDAFIVPDVAVNTPEASII